MDRVQFVLVAAVLLVAVATNGVIAQMMICGVPVSGLMECRSAVTPPNPAAPSAACCSTVSHANLACLCTYKNSGMLSSFGVDPKLALQLPAKCQLRHLPNC